MSFVSDTRLLMRDDQSWCQLWLSEIAAEREAQSGADFAHS
jgi:hypothetical protein